MTTLSADAAPAHDPVHMDALKAIIHEAQQTRFGTLALDLRKPHHLLHATRSIIGADENKAMFPALTRSLERTRLAHEDQGGPKPFTLFELKDTPINQFGAAAKILYCDILTPSNTAVVGGVVTLLQIAQTVQVTLQIVDNNTGQIIATEQPPISTNVYSTQVTIQGVISQPYNFTAVLTTAILPVGGAPMITLTDTCVNSGSEPVLRVTPTNPVSKQTPPRTYVKIGLNRTSAQQPDCDYWYSYGNTGPQPIVGVSVSGSAQLTSPPFSLAAQPGFNGYLFLYRRDSLIGGGCCIVYPPGTDMTTYVTPSGTQFTFNFPTDTFQGAPWDQNQTIDIDFFMQFSVQQSGQAAGLGRIRMTSIPQVYSTTPPPNVYGLLPLTFVWGCLRGGTMIRTATGEKAIEALEVGDLVYCADGIRTLPVTKTWIGWETTPLVRLVDEAGRSIELTTLHPVATESGMMAANALEVGMKVRVAGGELAKLVAVEQVPFEGHVYNIDLGDADEGTEATLIANGFAVGDNRAQGELAAQLLNREKQRSLQIPEDWVIDVDNSHRRAAGLPLIAEHSRRSGELRSA